MKNKFVSREEDIEKYRERIFKSKEKYRKNFQNSHLTKKFKISFELSEISKYLKNFKRVD